MGLTARGRPVRGRPHAGPGPVLEPEPVLPARAGGRRVRRPPDRLAGDHGRPDPGVLGSRGRGLPLPRRLAIAGGLLRRAHGLLPEPRASRREAAVPADDLGRADGPRGRADPGPRGRRPGGLGRTRRHGLPVVRPRRDRQPVRPRPGVPAVGVRRAPDHRPDGVRRQPAPAGRGPRRRGVYRPFDVPVARGDARRRDDRRPVAGRPTGGGGGDRRARPARRRPGPGVHPDDVRADLGRPVRGRPADRRLGPDPAPHRPVGLARLGRGRTDRLDSGRGRRLPADPTVPGPGRRGRPVGRPVVGPGCLRERVPGPLIPVAVVGRARARGDTRGRHGGRPGARTNHAARRPVRPVRGWPRRSRWSGRSPYS